MLKKFSEFIGESFDPMMDEPMGRELEPSTERTAGFDKAKAKDLISSLEPNELQALREYCKDLVSQAAGQMDEAMDLGGSSALEELMAMVDRPVDASRMLMLIDSSAASEMDREPEFEEEM